MLIDDLKKFAKHRGIDLISSSEIVQKMVSEVIENNSLEDIKQHFDTLLFQVEHDAYELYLSYEAQYRMDVFEAFTQALIEQKQLVDVNQTGRVLGEHFKTLDRFFMSLAQSRRTRTGRTFETIHNSLFEALGYPFDHRPAIKGTPDFLLPSVSHYKKNPIDCIIFTAKRTLRERGRQIVTERTRGLGFYLATIDKKISSNQLTEMLQHRIYLVCPKAIKDDKYSDANNVISFAQFFRDHLDPAMTRWKANKVIPND